MRKTKTTEHPAVGQIIQTEGGGSLKGDTTRWRVRRVLVRHVELQPVRCDPETNNGLRRFRRDTGYEAGKSAGWSWYRIPVDVLDRLELSLQRPERVVVWKGGSDDSG